jgi:hypothetical protein
MIFFPGVMMKGGRDSLPSAIIVLIIVNDFWFSGLDV